MTGRCPRAWSKRARSARGSCGNGSGTSATGWCARAWAAGARPPPCWFGGPRHGLRALGDRVVREGLGGGDAATALLLRRPPSVAGALLGDGETVAEAAV